MADPNTTLHYAPNANIVGGTYAPAVAGFNLADVSSAAAADLLPNGVLGLVYLGATSGVTASFMSAVNQAVGDGKVYGFYLADEPGPTVSAANLKAEADYIHSVDPNAKTFIVLENNGTPSNPSYSFTPANTDIDLFGIDPYPIRPQFSGGADYSVIGAAVTAAEAAGIPQSQLVPVYQAFGATSGTYSSWSVPTAAQEQTILSTWGQYLPNPAFDYAYSWGTQSGDTAISSDPALQAVFAAHNAVVSPTPTPVPTDVLASNVTAIAAITGETFSGPVATFTNSNTSILASGLTATINWGDGTLATTGMVTGGGGSFTVAGSHTYSAAGSDTVAVTVSEVFPGTATATADGTANVAPAPTPTPTPTPMPTPTPTDTTMTATASHDGATADVPIISTGSSTTVVGSRGVVSQTVTADAVDSVSFSGISSETLQFGSGIVTMAFINPHAITATGGSGTDTITANSGTNKFTAGTGTLDVTGGSGHASFVFHAGDGLLIIEDFSRRRDSLSVDKSLQGAFQATSDGHGGTMLTFGTAGQGIDLVGVASFSSSTVRFV